MIHGTEHPSLQILIRKTSFRPDQDSLFLNYPRKWGENSQDSPPPMNDVVVFVHASFPPSFNFSVPLPEVTSQLGSRISTTRVTQPPPPLLFLTNLYRLLPHPTPSPLPSPATVRDLPCCCPVPDCDRASLEISMVRAVSLGMIMSIIEPDISGMATRK